MAGYNDNLPGDCFVNDICVTEQGIHLDRELLDPYGFHPQQPASLIITQGQITITTDPKLCNILTAINELQCRQDEIGQDFEPAIVELVEAFKGGSS